MKLYLKRKDGWLYFAVGNWQPFKFFGASGWIALNIKWLVQRFFAETRRHWGLRFPKPINHGFHSACGSWHDLANCPGGGNPDARH